MALRLGLREIKGMSEAEAGRLVAARGAGYRSVAALQARAGLERATLEALARADAYRSLGLDRRRAFWAVRALPDETPPLFAADAIGDHPASAEPEIALPPAALGEEVVGDYASLGLSLRAHPLALLRPKLARRGVVRCAALGGLPAGQRVTVAGLVLVRQRPGTAKGVIFATLEDETGIANVIIWNHVFERFRRVVLSARLLACRGRLQREGLVIHVVAERLADLSAELDGLAEIDADGAGRIPPAGLRRPHGNYMPKSRDFH